MPRSARAGASHGNLLRVDRELPPQTPGKAHASDQAATRDWMLPMSLHRDAVAFYGLALEAEDLMLIERYQGRGPRRLRIARGAVEYGGTGPRERAPTCD